MTVGKVSITNKFEPESQVAEYVESYTKDFNAKLE
jgi:hypothetical protein